MSDNDRKKNETMDGTESGLSKLFGIWSGFAITTVIMFWIFPYSWIKWVVIISVLSGAIKKTLTIVEQNKESQSKQLYTHTPSHSGVITDETPSDSRYCPQCGTLLSPGRSQCSTCGYEI
ncbi:MAG: zinc ribbon domain-containing protein [Promethearchaeota archaeon]